MTEYFVLDADEVLSNEFLHSLKQAVLAENSIYTFTLTAQFPSLAGGVGEVLLEKLSP